jgi:HD domain
MKGSGSRAKQLAGLVLLTCVSYWCASALAAEPRSTSAASGSLWRETVRKFAQEHFKNPACGYSHSVRDYVLARQLANSDHVQLDDDVLYAAAYLHDMAAFAPWEKVGVDHADQAATIVDSVLKDTGFPMSKIDAVRGTIRTHMFDRDPLGPEALYLHDADALDWLGAIGVARVIALADPKGGKPTVPDVLPMLESNLANVPARVLSPAGRSRVSERAGQLETFLRELKRQSDDLRAL